MCLYPRLIPNPKYKKNKKNQGIIPQITDQRVTMVPIGCGNCIECRRQNARQWQVRLQEDIKVHKNAIFITLTFSNEKIKEITELLKIEWDDLNEQLPTGYDLDNLIATYAVRHFLERWRKRYEKSLRHWLITELGHKGTENVHLHGIVWVDTIMTPNKKKDITMETIHKIWQYGFIFPSNELEKRRTYVNNKTINYITKYVTKRDEKHKAFKATILTSPGIGGNYTKTGPSGDYNKNRYKGTNTVETYRTREGVKLNLPIYYRNKIYTEAEREKLWLQKLDKQERWVLGIPISIKNGEEEYEKVLKTAQLKNKKLGYGQLLTWEQKQYANQRRTIKIKQRIANVKQ